MTALTEKERLARIAELITPCPEPGIADGYDTCGHGEVWPCDQTRAAWLAAGLDEEAEFAKVMADVRQRFDIEQAEYDAMYDADPEAARRYSMQRLGW
jgi:hypothetical protein